MDSMIFDVDGTLWNSTEIVAKAWTKAIEENTEMHMVITAAQLRSLFGQTLPDIARQIFPEETTERQLELIDLCCEEEHRMLLKTPAPTYPGLEDTLEVLSKTYPLYIVSNCEAGYIETFLKTTGLGSYFQ